MLLAAIVIAGCGVALLQLVDSAIGSGGPGRVDHRTLAWIHERRTPSLNAFFRTATTLADGWFSRIVVAVAAAWLGAHRRLGLAAAVIVSSTGAGLVTSLLKDGIGRDRPPAVAHMVQASSEAFPSGHASQSIACYGAIALAIALTASRPSARIAAPVAAAIVALAIGASRVYLGVHWPTDVLGGYLTGLAWLTVVAAVSAVMWGLDRPRGWWARSPEPHPVRR